MPKVHYVTPEEIEALIAKGMTREEAEFKIIDKYAEVVFPDENTNVNKTLKENRKVAHVYYKKKGTVKRERKPDEDKRLVIDILYKALADFDEVEVKNIERQIDFKLNGRDYTVTLTKHNKEKDKE